MESQLKLTDSQLLFNIEALKIAKRARDLQNTAHLGRTRKKIKQNFLLNKLRKFRSLPNLSQIKNIAMRRIKSRTGKETQKYLDINRYLDINIFGFLCNVEKLKCLVCVCICLFLCLQKHAKLASR